MHIEHHLVNQIQKGKVILFLGAGASYGALNKEGRKMPLARELAILLDDEYLGGKYVDKSNSHSPVNLAHIGEMAIVQSDIVSVQEFIREQLDTFEPTPAHYLMSTFRWDTIATTNYDLLIEHAYRRNPKAVQKIQPFITDNDRVESKLRDPNSLALLKLHGCITHTTDVACPLLLTMDQITDYNQGRTRLFQQLIDRAFEHTILFVGYGLGDPNIRAVLNNIDKIIKSRPRSYSISPHMDDINIRTLEQKKVTGLRGTFEEFMQHLDSISSAFRAVPILTSRPDLPVFEKFGRNANPHSTTLDFIQNDVEYVAAIQSSKHLDPANFYKGMNYGWSAMEQNIDVRRKLTDDILTNHILTDESNHLQKMEIVLIKSYAGAGKSVLLQRIAWEAAKTYNKFCLYLNYRGKIKLNALKEILQISSERLYLFVDNIANDTTVKEILSLAQSIGDDGKKLTIIAAERINELHAVYADIGSLITESYELKYLDDGEIDFLLLLLERHRALGTLQPLSYDDRKEAFRKKADRQLLVALHEATLGKPFEDILRDEYENIRPFEARDIYNTICSLNRLDIPVRAGIISRVHGVPFEEFERDFFEPLDHIVKTFVDPFIKDNVYVTRHPHIAEIVFSFSDQEQKYDLYRKCLDNLNISYESDRKALRQMIRGRVLSDIFPNHDLARSILDLVESRIGTEGPDYIHLLHQSAIYEMKRPNGSLVEASNLLSDAMHLAPEDLTLRHTMALVCIDSAEKIARTTLEAETFLRDAIKLGHSITAGQSNQSHGYHVQLMAWLLRLRKSLANPNYSSNYSINDTIKEIEKILANGLQRFPDDSYLLTARSELEEMLEQYDRALISLETAFAGNPRSPYIALRLSEYYQHKGQSEKAAVILKTALEASKGEKRLHYAYACLLLNTKQGTQADLLSHLKKSYQPGDRFYEAKLLYGRQLYIGGQFNESKEIFRDLQNQNLGVELRRKIQYPLDGRFRGVIKDINRAYCRILRDGTTHWTFAAKENIAADIWDLLELDVRVIFSIGFTIRGDSAFSIELE